ncbi:MAG: AAA family ATPase, partial [Candidatus Diapherotrites archaeon]|nr:AAA family ATPase [Candidatus Diapherotrites archaeon]
MAQKKKTHDKRVELIGADFKTTEEVDVPTATIEQVIGQEKGVDIIKKASKQRRNVFLLGEPGTGKSMLGLAMAELLPTKKLQDLLVYVNEADPNTPILKAVKAGEGKKIIEEANKVNLSSGSNKQLVGFVVFLFTISVPWIMLHFGWISELMAAASLVVAGMLGIGVVVGMQLKPRADGSVPKLLIDNSQKKTAPFVEATGARAGALLGDVRHD